MSQRCLPRRAAAAAALLPALLMLVVDPAAGQATPETDGAAPAATVARGTVKTESFQSEALGKSMDYSIFLPPSYATATETRYPVVIFLHGLFEDHQRWLRSNRGGVDILQDLIAEKKIGEMIVAVPNADRGFGFYTNGKSEGAAYEDFIVKDFVNHLDATYRTRKKRESRVLLGVSMGGYGALKIAFAHPDLFAAVASHSAALFPPDLDALPEWAARALTNDDAFLAKPIKRTFGDPVDKTYWQANNPIWLVEQDKAPKGLAIYFDCGETDRYRFFEGNKSLHEAMQKAGIPHEYAIRPGGHGWDYTREYLPLSLEFLDRAIRSHS